MYPDYDESYTENGDTTKSGEKFGIKTFIQESKIVNEIIPSRSNDSQQNQMTSNAMNGVINKISYCIPRGSDCF